MPHHPRHRSPDPKSIEIAREYPTLSSYTGRHLTVFAQYQEMSSSPKGCEVRCDRRRPDCGFCSKNGITCRYEASRKTPGIRAGYVTQLEQRIADLEDEFASFRQQFHSNTNVNSQKDSERNATTDVRHQSRDGPGTIPAPTSLGRQTLVEPTQTASPYLTKTTITKLCTTWFDQYHTWLPILHQPSIMLECEQLIDGGPISIVLKAICAIIQPPAGQSATGATMIPDDELQKIGNEIILESVSNVALETLQALIILSIAEYGSGRMEKFYNLISICKRISTQLGLRDMVALHCINFGVSSSFAAPRMLDIPVSAVERESKVRAFWAADALDSASTVGVAWHLSVSRPEPSASVPCDDEIWQYPEPVLAAYPFSNLGAPSSFSLFVRLATNELWHVHNHLQQTYDPSSLEALRRRQSDCDAVYQRLLDWHGDFEQLLSVSSPMYADLFASATSGSATTTQHPNSILIHCTVHSAIISLHQRFAATHTSQNEIDDGEFMRRAADRCLSSSDHIATTVRSVSDAVLESTNPHVIYSVFIAARFCIIYSRIMGLPVPNRLYLLIYALRVCGNKWSLARQLHLILEQAMAEFTGSWTSQNQLPTEFWDLQYFALDIHAALRRTLPVLPQASIGSA